MKRRYLASGESPRILTFDDELSQSLRGLWTAQAAGLPPDRPLAGAPAALGRPPSAPQLLPPGRQIHHGGRLLALSTPFGTRGWWYDAWRSEEPWERYEVPAQECPRITEDFLAEERRTMGEWWFAQEYECKFQDGETQPFAKTDNTGRDRAGLR